MKELFEYFEENWQHRPYPIIDHALRIDRLPNGTFHFYIHPSGQNGITCDFITSETETKSREQ